MTLDDLYAVVSMGGDGARQRCGQQRLSLLLRKVLVALAKAAPHRVLAPAALYVLLRLVRIRVRVRVRVRVWGQC